MTNDVTSEESPNRRERLIYVPVSQLSEAPHAPSAIAVPEDFIQSLKTYGVLHPLLVRPGDSGYEVIAGFRRLRAAKAAGLTEVPVRVYRAEDASLTSMYAASNKGVSGKAPKKTAAPLSQTDGISGGTLGGFLEDELGRDSQKPPYGLIVGISAVVLILAWIGLVVTRRIREQRPERPEPAVVVNRESASQRPVASNPIDRTLPMTVISWRTALSDIDGITVRDISGIPRIVFDEPVFSRLTTVDPDQKERLRQVAETVFEIEPRSVLMVIGHTDNDPIRPNSRYRSNEYLSELRANSVIDTLKEVGSVPANKLKPVAVGAQDPPFPNTNAADKVRNRTVTLEILQPVN